MKPESVVLAGIKTDTPGDAWARSEEHMGEAVRDITSGHEIWLETHRSHYHQGSDIDLHVGFGHALKTDGSGERAKWKAYTIAPSGKRLLLPIKDGKDDLALISFRAEEEGYYTVIVENNFGIGTKLLNGEFRRGARRDYDGVDWSAYYYQYAQVRLLVGQPHGSAERTGCDLEICATLLTPEQVRFEVLYLGMPLSGGRVEVTRASDETDEFFASVELDDQGRGVVPVLDRDLWLFKVSHSDTERRSAGLYDRMQLAATVTLNIQEGNA